MDAACMWDMEEPAETTMLDQTKILDECKTFSSLYQLETCVKVTPRTGVVDHAGSVLLCSSADSVAVAMGNQLMLFDAREHQLTSTLNLDRVVDCLTFSCDGGVLVACERSGGVYVIDAKNGRQMSSQRLETPGSDDNTPVFQAVEFGESDRLAVMTASGLLHVIDGFLTDQPEHFSVVISDPISCLAVASTGDIVICSADGSINLWSSRLPDTKELILISSCMMLSGPAVKCVAVPGRHFVLVVDTDGLLVSWNTDQLVAVSMLDCPPVLDFLVVDRPGDAGNWGSAVATLHAGDGGSGLCLNIYSLPCAELVYSADLNPGASLFRSSVLNDSVYVLESRLDNTPGWRVRRLAETAPQTRLRRLLAKQRFGDAEKFAEQFDLDVQVVYRESVSYLISKLSVSEVDDKELSTRLVRCLSLLDDVPNVVECCITAVPSSLSTATQLLRLASERFSSAKSLSAELHASLSARLLDTMRRLAAFQGTFGAEEYSRDRWRQFREADLYVELCSWLRTGRLDVAGALCDRYADVLFPRIVSLLDEVLALIPDAVPQTDLRAWMQHCIVPPVLASQDLGLIRCLATWVEKRITDMEVTQKRAWPANAIELCDVLTTNAYDSVFKTLTPKDYSFQLVGLAVPLATAGEARTSQNALLRLRVLRSDLQRIAELRDKYRCWLSLAEFRSETVQSLVFRFLDRVHAVELLSSAISDTVCPYAAQNGLSVDSLLLSYIEEWVHKCCTGGMRPSTVWESKAVEIVGQISNRAQRLRALLTILTVAHFPWSECVAEAVQTASAENPNNLELKEQCRVSELKQTLISYDLRMFNFAELTHAQDLAFYILMQDRETAVEDALAVASVYGNVRSRDVLLFRCRFLAERNRSDELLALFRGVTPQTLLDEVCQSFVQYSVTVISTPFHKYRQQYAAATRYVGKLLPSLSVHLRTAVQDQLSNIEAVDALRSVSGKFVSAYDYSTSTVRRQICDQVLTETPSVSTEVGSTRSKPEAKLRSKASRRRLARLLWMSPSEAEMVDGVSAAESRDIEAAVKCAERIVQKMGKDGVGAVQRIVKVLSAICNAVDGDVPITKEHVTTIHQLCSHLLLKAPSMMVSVCLKIVRSTRLAVEMSSQCPSDQDLVPVDGSVDPYTQWAFDDYLSDDDCGGLVMDSRCTMPLAFSFVAASLPAAESCFKRPESEYLDAVAGALSDVTELLTSNDQTRLLLGYILEVAALVGGVSAVDEMSELVIVTLRQCVTRRRADFQLALTCVFSLSPTIAYETLHKLARSAGIQYKKVLAVALMGLAFAKLTNNRAGVEVAEPVVTEARWGYRLAKVQVSFRQCFRGEAEDKAALLPKLAACDAVSVTDVREYCTAFKLDVSGTLVQYLSYFFLRSSEGVDLGSVPFSTVRQRAEDACRCIEHKTLATTLDNLFDKVSPYDYERQEFILDQISRSTDLVERSRKLLVCLKSYRRVAPPSEDELMSGFPVIGERLPLHLLSCKKRHWPIITGELNAATVDLWIPMAAILSLSADDIYTTAIRNIVQDHVRQVTRTSPAGVSSQWAETSIDHEFMDSVLHLLRQMNTSELKAACAGWLAHELPPGAEKVLACRWCVELHEKWAMSCSLNNKATAVLEKHRLRRRQIAVEQVLYTSGLAEPGLLSLTLSPARLIFKLYEHPSIVDRIRNHSFLVASPSCSAVAGLPDIHAVVDRIAAIGSIDASKVRLTLLDKWLAPHRGDDQLESADVTMVGEELGSGRPMDAPPEDPEIDDVDLIRAVYILQHPAAQLEDTAMSLISAARSNATSAPQIRVVKCLFMLADAEAVRSLSDHSDWAEFLAGLIYVAELRRWRVLADSWRGSFAAVDKSGLVRALCRCRDATSGRVAACLAVDFGLRDDQLWSAVVRRLTASDLGLLLRPLPCHGTPATDAVCGLVSRGLREDGIDVQHSVTIALLLARCPTCVDPDLLSRYAREFSDRGFPLCALACLTMSGHATDLTGPIIGGGSVLGGVDSELEAIANSGHVLPTLELILSVVNTKTQP